MPVMTVSINVPEVSEEEIYNAIVIAATKQVLGQYGEIRTDDDGNEYVEYSQKRLDAMRKDVGERVNAAVDALVKKVAPDIVNDVLNAEFTPTNEWGEARGKPTTMRALIASYAKAWLEAKVDDNGREGYGASRVRLQWIVAKEVEQQFNTKLRAEAEKAAEMVKAGLVAKAGELVKDGFTKALAKAVS